MAETPPTQSEPSTETGHISDAAWKCAAIIAKELGNVPETWLEIQIQRAIDSDRKPTDKVLNEELERLGKIETLYLELLEKSDSASPWIKTAERPPTEKDGRILAVTFQPFIYAAVTDAGNVISSPQAWPLWMPIPPVPQQHKKEIL